MRASGRPKDEDGAGTCGRGRRQQSGRQGQGGRKQGEGKDGMRRGSMRHTERGRGAGDSHAK